MGKRGGFSSVCDVGREHDACGWDGHRSDGRRKIVTSSRHRHAERIVSKSRSKRARYLRSLSASFLLARFPRLFAKSFLPAAEREGSRAHTSTTAVSCARSEGTSHFDDYVDALDWAQRFARLNREEMMRLTT